MTETTERFLQEIATRVGYDRVAELYLFPVLRQGGVEGAVAVVAAYPEPVAATVESAPEDVQQGGQQGASAPQSSIEPPEEQSVAETSAEAVVQEQESEGSVAPDAARVGGDEPSDAAVQSESGDVTEPSEAAEPVESIDPVVEPELESASARRPERARHVVYTARYRHTIKGTDRGRWLVEVVAEADAPLVTVEEVVRGVVRRSGEAFQPERISGDQFRSIVPAPAVLGSAPA